MPDSPQFEPVLQEDHPPLYAEDSSIDDKGRLKMPLAFQKYLRAAAGAAFMATTYDLKKAIVYTSSDFVQFRKDLIMQLGPVKANTLIGIMERFGAESKLDGEGRLSLPGALKTQLRLDHRQKVWMRFRNRRIEILREEDYDREFQVHQVNLDDALLAFQETGL